MTFHAKDGWFFERQADGSVWVFQRAGGRADGEIVATVVLDPDSWASVVASMCAEGETADTFSWAGAFHQGKVQSFIAALASTRHDLETHMDAAKVREAALAESRGELDRLRAQVREFRQKCDPREDHVLVTADELAAPRGLPMNQPDSAEIEAIAAREAKATPGPWIASHESVSDIHGFDCQSQVTYPDGQGNYGFAPADAEFIAHARQDIPTLLAALATAEERAEKWFAAFTEAQESAVTLSRELLAAAKIENAAPGATGEGS